MCYIVSSESPHHPYAHYFKINNSNGNIYKHVVLTQCLQFIYSFSTTCDSDYPTPLILTHNCEALNRAIVSLSANLLWSIKKKLKWNKIERKINTYIQLTDVTTYLLYFQIKCSIMPCTSNKEKKLMYSQIRNCIKILTLNHSS